jgi:hypothetical protein
MKNLLKISLVLAFVATTFISNAQFNSEKLTFGVKAGLNLADIAQDFKMSEDEDDTKTLTGLAFGVTAEYYLQEKLAFQSGLMISRKGAKSDYKDEWGSSEDKIKVTWLEIPMNLAYKMDAFQFYAGPYVAFGLSGELESEYSEDGESYSSSTDVKFGDSDSDHVRGFDYGLNLGLGYQTGNLLFNAGYSLGLANLTPNDSDGEIKTSNRVISFSVSYLFGK